MLQWQMKSQEAEMSSDLQASIDEALAAAEAAAARVGAKTNSDANTATMTLERPSSDAKATAASQNADMDDLSAQIDSLLDEAQVPVDPPVESLPEASASSPAAKDKVDESPAPYVDTAKLAAVDDLLAQHASQVMAEELDEPSAVAKEKAAPVAEVSASTAQGHEPAALEAAQAQKSVDTKTEHEEEVMVSPRPRVHLAGPRALCALLNRPLAHASPQTRSLVGLIGLMTCFNAAALFFYALLGG